MVLVTGIGELSFRWIQICIGSPMRRSSFLCGCVLQYSNLSFVFLQRYKFLGGLRVTNPPIRLMCQTSVCLSVRLHFRFRTLNSKTVCPIKFKLDREIDHHHS